MQSAVSPRRPNARLHVLQSVPRYLLVAWSWSETSRSLLPQISQALSLPWVGQLETLFFLWSERTRSRHSQRPELSSLTSTLFLQA